MQYLRHVIISAVLFMVLSTPTLAALTQSQVDYDSKTKQILILHSYHPGLPSTNANMTGIQEALTQALEHPNIHVEYLDTKRHPDSEYFAHVLDVILHYKLEKSSFDLIMVSGNEALNFVLEHRDELFANTPIVFSAIESFPEAMLKGQKQMTGVIQDPDYRGLIEQALRFHPQAKRAVIVGRTTGFTNQQVNNRLHNLIKNFTQIDFEFWSDLSHHELIQKLEALSPDELVFISGLFMDQNGNLPCFLCERNPGATIRAPIYSPLEIYFGKGTIGGLLIDSRQQGRLAGELALQILSGTNPDDLPVIRPNQGVPRFDSLALKRHNISAGLLPPNAQLINQPPNVYALSKTQIQALIISLVMSFGLIFILSTNFLKRLKAERLYKQLSQQFQVILTGIPDRLTLITPEMKVIWSNKGEAEYFRQDVGADPEVYCCKLPYNKEMLCNNCLAAESLKSGNIGEATIINHDGLILEVKAFPLKDTQGSVTSAILLASDVTEKTNLREEAIRASQLASLGELAAGVAHEINNPNALIKLNAELVKSSFEGAIPILQKHFEQHGDFALGGLTYSEIRDEIPYLFKEMLEGSERIKNIVSDLKDFSRNDTPNHDDLIDINDLARTAIRLINNMIKNSTDHFRTDFADHLPIVNGSFQRIEQVVVNLLVNACQALSNKTETVRISTRHDAQNHWNILEVRDEGIGISSTHLDRITEPFFTTKRKEGGTGLGLSLASRIVADHGGKLDFNSQQGQGTTVTLTLPTKMTGEHQ
ncbi:MAG: ATP-binding protein [Desulfuromusa sp.]|nr:ATP-binding protein [Desulfuromusa sp.]